jgi:hypothetical protein
VSSIEFFNHVSEQQTIWQFFSMHKIDSISSIFLPRSSGQRLLTFEWLISKGISIGQMIYFTKISNQYDFYTFEAYYCQNEILKELKTRSFFNAFAIHSKRDFDLIYTFPILATRPPMKPMNCKDRIIRTWLATTATR